MGDFSPVGLSLGGRGRVVTLTPRTIRRVFYLFMEGTQRSTREIEAQLRHNWLTDRDQCIPLANRLLSRRSGLLSLHEIARLELHLNMLAIRSDWRLMSRQECVIDSSALITVHGDVIDRRRGVGIIFNGACFEVAQISRSELLGGGPRDVFVEDRNRELRFLRFSQVRVHRGLLKAQVSSRYDVNFKWLEPLVEFRPRRIFSVLRAQPLPGFHISDIEPFLSGRS
jgi:hypothetical protein